MNLQEDQLHFFERLYLELGFSSVPPKTEELLSSINSSRSTHLIYKNSSSGETLDGSFYLEKNFLVYYQAETMELPDIILDLSYARLHTILRCNEKAAPKIHLEKNQNLYEIVFDDKNTFEDWMLKLRRICVLTNFEKKYQIAEVTEKKGDVQECLLEAKMGGTHYSARKFDKKQISFPANSLAMVRLMNEIEILRALRTTEKVLPLNGIYETEDSVYLVTGFVHSMTLKKMLKAASSLFSEAKTRTIMQQILKTLAHMASKNIIHRNLKPSNIIMENKQKIRITNFGLATFINAPKANVGICGTPGYIAPEILHSNGNRVYDDKADVFSAGCIFFEMLLGYPLFKGSKASEVSSSNKHFKYSELVQLVTKEFNNAKLNSTKFGLDLLLKLLHNDPQQRLSAEEALGDVYFDSQETFPSSNESTPRNYREKSSPNTPRNSWKISFDPSPSTSISPTGSFSETASYEESSSTLYPSYNSIRKSSEDYYGKCHSPSNFKNQPRFKSAQEMKLPVLNEKRGSGLLTLQKIDFTGLNNKDDGDDSDILFGESPISKNHPKKSPRIQKHPSQRT